MLGPAAELPLIQSRPPDPLLISWHPITPRLLPPCRRSRFSREVDAFLQPEGCATLTWFYQASAARAGGQQAQIRGRRPGPPPSGGGGVQAAQTLTLRDPPIAGPRYAGGQERRRPAAVCLQPRGRLFSCVMSRGSKHSAASTAPMTACGGTQPPPFPPVCRRSRCVPRRWPSPQWQELAACRSAAWTQTLWWQKWPHRCGLANAPLISCIAPVRHLPALPRA